MIISPEKAIECGWIKGIANKEIQVQPNAIDFTIDQAFKIKESTFELYCTNDNKEEKRMRGVEELTPYRSLLQKYPTWTIEGGGMIDGMSNMYVEIPDDVAVMLVLRSTLTRNGLFIASGLYDSGFKGHIGFVLHNHSKGKAYVGPGVRVGQMIFIAADSVGQYTGQWNHDEGTDFANLV